MANAYFQFRRVDKFFYDMNRKDCFDLADMNGVDENYKLVLASNCSTNIEDCLDEDGTLKEWNSITNTGVEILNTLGERDGLLPLLYTEGINGEGIRTVLSHYSTMKVSMVRKLSV